MGLLLLTLQPIGSAVITRDTYFSSECSFPIAAIANYLKPSGFKYLFVLFWTVHQKFDMDLTGL